MKNNRDLPKNILIAPCAYKGTFSPLELCQAIAFGIKRVFPAATAHYFPLADGGDGTIESLHYLLEGELKATKVLGPTDKMVDCRWLLTEYKDSKGKRALVELASASGIAHLEGENLAPLLAHTRGCGQVIKECLNQGIKDVCLTVGGSASTDGGTGILHELGARFLDEQGRELKPCGKNLIKISFIDTDKLVKTLDGVSLTVLCDVNNPLFGEHGAAYVYGPQKGASPAIVEELDRGLRHFASVMEKTTGVNASGIPGAGAAGGVPFAMVSVQNSDSVKLVSGFEWFSDATNLANAVEKSDLVIGAEGHLDSQSLQGKAIGELAHVCRQKKTPLWIIPARAAAEVNWSDFGIEAVEESAQSQRATLQDVERAAATLCRKLKSVN